MSESPSVDENMLTNMLPMRIEISRRRGLARRRAVTPPPCGCIRCNFFIWKFDREKRVVSVHENKNEIQRRANMPIM
jgi:hypothetical protein